MQALIITLATPVFFLLIFIELFLSWKMKRDVYRVDDAINSIGLGILSQVSAVFTRVLAFGIYALAFEHVALFELSTSSVAVWVGALIAYDFCYYWLHRMGHEFSILWAAHVVHHQSEEYNLSTALRQTSTGQLLGWLFYLPLAVAGVPPVVFAGVAMIDLLYQFWIHTQLVGKLGWFDHVFASPSNHRVHHAVNDKYLDKNYGGILIIWDKIFGTFEEEDDKEPPVYGTRSQLKSWNPLWANLEVYSSMWNDMRRTGTWSNRWRVLVSRTGWRPADVEALNPKEPFKLDRPKFMPAPTLSVSLYATIQFAVLLGAAVHFLQVQATRDWWPLGFYALWILGSLTSIGVLLEGRRSGVYLEQARWGLTGLMVLLSGHWFLTGPAPSLLLASILLWSIISPIWIGSLARSKPLSEKEDRLAAADDERLAS